MTAQQLIETERLLPFLPGQHMGVSQGNDMPYVNADNDGKSDFNHRGEYIVHGIDFSIGGDIDRGIPVIATSDGFVTRATRGIADTADWNLQCRL